MLCGSILASAQHHCPDHENPATSRRAPPAAAVSNIDDTYTVLPAPVPGWEEKGVPPWLTSVAAAAELRLCVLVATVDGVFVSNTMLDPTLEAWGITVLVAQTIVVLWDDESDELDCGEALVADALDFGVDGAEEDDWVWGEALLELEELAELGHSRAVACFANMAETMFLPVTPEHALVTSGTNAFKALMQVVEHPEELKSDGRQLGMSAVYTASQVGGRFDA